MAVCYDKLFHLMIDKKISNVQLKDMAGVSANIITRLKRDEYISTESIEKICLALNCGVDDILEFVPEKEGLQSQGKPENFPLFSRFVPASSPVFALCAVPSICRIIRVIDSQGRRSTEALFPADESGS